MVLLNNLAATPSAKGEPREAQLIYRRALDVCKAALPADDPKAEHVRAKLRSVEETILREQAGEESGVPRAHVR